ncbi:MAG: hypothetical protein FIB02_06340 [Desulfuromonas sp.]|nr:hypothetical protein [Desulfuromonas sp.]
MAEISLTISGILLVDDLCVAEMESHTEFHVDCLALSVCGDLIPVGIYDSSSDPDETARLQDLLQPGNLLAVRDAAVVDHFSTMRLHGPALTRFEGDIDQLRRKFAAAKNRCDRKPAKTTTEDCDRVRGRISECRIFETKSAGPMAIATVETDEGIVEAFFFPEIFANLREIIAWPGILELAGELNRPELQGYSSGITTLVVQSAMISS